MSQDITFCPNSSCELKRCRRNPKWIADKSIPHSYSVEIPDDCPKFQWLFNEGYVCGYKECKNECYKDLITLRDMLAFVLERYGEKND